MAEQPRRQRTADCALCGREIVMAPRSHIRLAAGQRAHFDCYAICLRSGYVRPGIHLVIICQELGCDDPYCHRWTHRKAVLERPEPGAIEHPPPFALAVDKRPDCELCRKPLDGDPPFQPNLDGRFMHIACAIDRVLRGLAQPER